ncbi:MAG: hypothetical protein ACOX2I_09610 [Candidatus Ozemobacteraceae bacterium]
MKILLVGEFSSFHNYLKDGLVKLGHEVVIVANGDGWKNIPCDLTWQSPYKGIIGKLHSFYKLLILSKQLVEYDVVQLIFTSFLKIIIIPLNCFRECKHSFFYNQRKRSINHIF